MDGMKVIHLEDSVDKHMKVCRELQKIGVISVEWATSVSEGLRKSKPPGRRARPMSWSFLICTIRSGGARLPIGRPESICSRLWPRETSIFGHHLLHPELPHTGRVWQYLVF